MSNDRSYLERLQEYYARHRALPSYASIGHLLGLKSKSGIHRLISGLEKPPGPRRADGSGPHD